MIKIGLNPENLLWPKPQKMDNRLINSIKNLKMNIR